MEFVFWACYLATLLLCYTLFRASGAQIERVSVGTITFVILMTIAYMGYPAIVLEWVPYYVGIGVTDSSVLWKMFLLSSAVMIQFWFGFYAGSRLLGSDEVKIAERSPERPFWIWFALLAVSSFFTYRYILSMAMIPVLEILDPELTAKDLAQKRSDFASALGGSSWMRQLFSHVFTPFLCMVGLVQGLMNREWKWIAVSAVGFFLATFTVTLDLQKSLFVEIMLMITLVIFALRKWPLKVSRLFLPGVAVFAAMVASYFLFMKSDAGLEVVLFPIRRIMTGQLIPFYFYLQEVPNIDYALLGKTLPNPAGIFDFQVFEYTRHISAQYFPHSKGVYGSAPTGFFGELWINFGYFGLIGLPMLLGLAVYGVHRAFSLFALGAIGISLMIWSALHLKHLALTGISYYLLDEKWLGVLGLAFILTIPKLAGGIYEKMHQSRTKSIYSR